MIFADIVLANSHNENRKLSSILYLHYVPDIRIQGSVLRNGGMFRNLCGDGFSRRHTGFGTELTQIKLNREHELTNTEEFWGQMAARIADVEVPGTQQSGKNWTMSESRGKWKDWGGERGKIQRTMKKQNATSWPVLTKQFGSRTSIRCRYSGNYPDPLFSRPYAPTCNRP